MRHHIALGYRHGAVQLLQSVLNPFHNVGCKEKLECGAIWEALAGTPLHNSAFAHGADADPSAVCGLQRRKVELAPACKSRWHSQCGREYQGCGTEIGRASCRG